MSIEFPYLSLSKSSLLRPYIPISIHYRRGIERTLALLDSGADYTFVPLRIASKVGLSLSPRRILIVHGVGGEVEAYKTQATLIFYLGKNEEFSLSRVTVLVPKDIDFRHTLLGRDTIFNEFIISFDEYDKKVIFEKKFH